MRTMCRREIFTKKKKKPATAIVTSDQSLAMDFNNSFWMFLVVLFEKKLEMMQCVGSI